MIFLAQASQLCNRARPLSGPETAAVATLARTWHAVTADSSDPDARDKRLEELVEHAESRDIRRALFERVAATSSFRSAGSDNVELPCLRRDNRRVPE